MTWKYKITDARNLSVYDHTESHVTTVMNDGSGVEIPGDVLDVMFDEAVAAYENAGGTVDEYTLRVLADAAFEQIEEGEP